MAFLEVNDIKKSFGKNEILKGISFDLQKGEVLSIIGSSGSGKTTLLRCINFLEFAESGTITVNGEMIYDGVVDKKIKEKDLRKKRLHFGLVFQDFNLFPQYDVLQNLTLAPSLLKMGTKEELEVGAKEIIKKVGLEDRINHYPCQLSGGQRQRVAFARALAPNPQLLLLDEPFAAIDAKVRKELRSWLREMIEKLGVTSIFVTHDQDEAIEVADEIIITNKGRIEQTGTPIEIYHNPKTAFTASFFGETTFVDDYLKFHNFEHIENVEKAIVRPDFVKVTKKNEVQKYKSSASHGVTKNVLFRGDSIEVVVDVDGTELKARRGLDEQAIEVGEEVDVFLYRIFVTVGDKAYLLDNKSISEDSLVI